MSKIRREYWEWRPELNNSIYKLGMNINQFNQIKKLCNGNYSVLNDENIAELEFVNNKLQTIILSRYVKNFIQFDLWNLAYDEFIYEMDSYLNRLNTKSKYKLFVVFRDKFIAFVKISIILDNGTDGNATD